MTESSYPVDFLSFCPSLLSILQYVDYKDVPNCRLVNKRVSELIQNHYLTMQRKNASLSICNVAMEWIPAKFACVNVTTVHHSPILAYVTEKRTVLIHYTGEVANYYWKNGIPSEYAPDKEDEQIRAIIREMHSGEDLEKSRSYQNNGIVGGLRALFTILCPRYKFINIHLKQEFMENYNPQQKKKGIVPEGWLNVMGEVFHRNLCYTDQLHITQHMQGLERFTKIIGCHDIYLYFYSTESDFMKNIIEISSWDTRIRLCFTLLTFVSFKETGILEQWKTGSLSLKKVELRAFCNSLLCTWSQTMDDLMDELKDAHFEKEIIPDEHIEYVVKRTADSKKLQITCKGYFLNIKEVL